MAAIAAESISRFKDQSNDQSTGAAIYARAELLVTQHLADPELNQSIVAGQLGISTRYLRYLFAERETTFSRYLLERRLQRAERMLRDTGCARGRVSRIAYECGFNNVSHFARVFTAHYGCPPSQIYSGSDAAR